MREPFGRQNRMLDLWSWLPAFRMVAEREQVQGASRELHVSASTLSRAVGLVEDRLGKRLFDRVGRNLQLNREGRELLEALRDGMRRIDDGVARVTDTVFRGDFRLAVEGDQLLTPISAALVRLHQEHRGMSFTVSPSPAPMAQLEPGLLQGRFDLAFVMRPPVALTRRRLRIEKIGVVTYGVYCGPRHPLYASGRRSIAVTDLAAHAFVAPTPSDDGSAGDEWPADIERHVALYLPALAPAMAVCAAGDLLAVLPDAVVAREGAAGASGAAKGLRRLRLEIIKPQTVHAVRRPVIGPDDLAGQVLAEVKRELATTARPSSARGQAGGGRRKAGERRP
jgi:DNA-binding transcriptional LysR family regulator